MGITSRSQLTPNGVFCAPMIPAMIISPIKDLGGTYRKFDENNFQIARQGVHGYGHPVFVKSSSSLQR